MRDAIGPLTFIIISIVVIFFVGRCEKKNEVENLYHRCSIDIRVSYVFNFGENYTLQKYTSRGWLIIERSTTPETFRQFCPDMPEFKQ